MKTSVKIEKQSSFRTLMISSCLFHVLSKCEVIRIREISFIFRLFDVKSTFKFEIFQISMTKLSTKKCEIFNIEYQCVKSFVFFLKFECEIVDLKKIQIFFSKFSIIEKTSRIYSNQTRK